MLLDARIDVAKVPTAPEMAQVAISLRAAIRRSLRG
jgi:hypothetical protein